MINCGRKWSGIDFDISYCSSMCWWFFWCFFSIQFFFLFLYFFVDCSNDAISCMASGFWCLSKKKVTSSRISVHVSLIIPLCSTHSSIAFATWPKLVSARAQSIQRCQFWDPEALYKRTASSKLACLHKLPLPVYLNTFSKLNCAQWMELTILFTFLQVPVGPCSHQHLKRSCRSESQIPHLQFATFRDQSNYASN